MSEAQDIKYAGFWVRFLASLVDTFVLALPIAVVVYFLSGGEWFDFAQYKQNLEAAMSGNSMALSNQPQTSMKWEVLFEVLVLFSAMLFWRKSKGATPGKHFVGIKVVDKDSFEIISTKESIIRGIGYFLTSILIFIAIPMMIIRKDRRTIHDLLASTAVIYENQKKDEGKEDESRD